MLRAIRLVTFLVAVFATAWSIALASGSGIHVVIGGHLVRSTDPLRPGLWAIGAAFLFVVISGPAALVRAWHRVRRAIGVRVSTRFALARGMSLVIAAALLATSAAFMTTVASGADGSGYVSQADRWIHGTLKPPQPWVGEVPWPNPRWTFTPLGYKPVDDAPPYAQAPTYSPGLSLLMAAAKIVGGQAALFLVVPLCAGVLVLATYGVARRLGGRSCGLVAAWLTATSPIVIWMLMFPMSDVPVAAAWVSALFFLLEPGARGALTAGLLSSLAILIRPNLFFLAPIMSLWFVIQPGGWATSRGQRLRELVLYAAGVAPAVIFIALLYQYLFGSPFVSGYGRFSDLLDRANIRPNLWLYFHWAMGAQSVFTIAGLAGVLLPWCWPDGTARRAAVIVALMFLAITAEYAAYVVFDDWTFLRFFLPAWPLLAIGAAGIARVIWSRAPWSVTVLLVGAVVAIGMIGIDTANQRHAFDLWHGNRRYTAAANLIQALSPPNSAVFAMEHSGSLRYYSGRIPIRYDEMPPDWLDRSVAWLARSGVHCYAVLDAWELEPFRDRFKGQHTVDALDAPILLYQAYEHGAIVYFFDLTTPPTPGPKPPIVTETDPGHWRNWPPGPEPRLVLHAVADSRLR